MILLQEAARAKDIADILGKFRLHDTDPGIPAAVERLDDLATRLRDLERLIDARDAHVERIFADDVELLQHSVAFTLQDIWTILGRMPDHCIGHDYRNTWSEIRHHCRNSTIQSLSSRLEVYALFAAQLCRVLRSEPTSRRTRIEALRTDILLLRRSQLDNRRLITANDAIHDLSVMRIRQLLPAPIPMRQPRSAERVRPPNIRTLSPTESNISWESVRHPPVPDPPLSPLSPTATYSTISQTSGSEVDTKHWAPAAFKDLPSTHLHDERNARQTSRCFGGDRHDGHDWPKREYEEVLKIKFPSSLRMHYYIRGRDGRAKIVCEWPDGRNRNRWSCLPLSDLHVRRVGSLLYLCRAVPGIGGSTAWAAFKFHTIEYLVIFHCTFLSLRSHDDRKHTRNMFDRELHGETLVFAGGIRDGGFRHALRIFRDRSTGSLRLEASVLEGEMLNTPIWTAFITHHVTSPRWLSRRRDSPTIYLGDLKRHVFSSNYTPHIAANGSHILDFDLLTDAQSFEQTIDDFRERYRQMPGDGP